MPSSSFMRNSYQDEQYQKWHRLESIYHCMGDPITVQMGKKMGRIAGSEALAVNDDLIEKWGTCLIGARENCWLLLLQVR